MEKEPQIYLASASPRRAELLRQIGVRFQLLLPEATETVLPNELPTDYVQRVALAKAQAAEITVTGETKLPILAADTAVIIGENILGKPQDKAQAIAMLQQLSGREHQVLTAVALVFEQQSRVLLSQSQVCFREISAREMQAYWQTGEPQDKAGGYAIQGLGSVFVAQIVGSYSGIVGLPLFETASLLSEFNIKVLL